MSETHNSMLWPERHLNELWPVYPTSLLVNYPAFCICAPLWNFGVIRIVWAVYVRIPFPTDDNCIALCLRGKAVWQREFFGKWITLTRHNFSKFEIAWRWEGMSMRKSPYSSVVPFAQFDFILLPLVWHETTTEAPVGIMINSLSEYVSYKLWRLLLWSTH